MSPHANASPDAQLHFPLTLSPSLPVRLEPSPPAHPEHSLAVALSTPLLFALSTPFPFALSVSKGRTEHGIWRLAHPTPLEGRAQHLTLTPRLPADVPSTRTREEARQAATPARED